MLGHIQDGNKTTDEGTDDHEPDQEQATDLAVYFNTANGDVTSPRSSPSTSTTGSPDPLLVHRHRRHYTRLFDSAP